MPSPVLHSLAGLVLLKFMRDAAPTRRAHLVVLGALIFAANAPDLDFVPGILAGEPGRFHHGATHSLLAAGVFALAAILVARWAGCRSAFRVGLLLGLAFTSHLFLDMLSSSSDARHGVALAWPLMTQHLAFPFPVFVGIRLDPTAGNFFQGVLHRHNLHAVAWELVVLGVIWGLARMIRRASPGGA